MAELTVKEASEAYESSMRNVSPAGPGVCWICKTFIDPGYQACIPCSRQPNPIQVVVPISYSPHLDQVHHALASYKNAPVPEARRYATVRLAGILWRFLEAHEPCVARAAQVPSFDLVTTVPSSSPAADEQRGRLRLIVSWCEPVASRFERVLRATGEVHGRHYDEGRYRCEADLSGKNVLLVDDTWTSGGHAQSAGRTLIKAGASTVAAVVIGRHLRPEWELTPGGETSGDRYDALPRRFDWTTCAVH